MDNDDYKSKKRTSLKGRENFYRYSSLIVDHTKEAFTDLIQLQLQNKKLSFEDFINLNQHAIYHLCYNNKNDKCCQCISKNDLPHHRVLCEAQLEVLFDKQNTPKLCHTSKTTQNFCCATAKRDLSLNVLDSTLARCLLINFCSEVFWNSCFKSPTEKLEDFLNTKKHELYHLLEGNITCCLCANNSSVKYIKKLNKYEWKKLFYVPRNLQACVKNLPNCIPCSVTANPGLVISQLDKQLVNKILDNLCPLRQSINVLTEKRNIIYGHANEATIYDTKFELIWNETENELLQIALFCGNELEKVKKFTELKNCVLDETSRQQIDKALHQFQDYTQYVGKIAQEVKEDVQALRGNYCGNLEDLVQNVKIVLKQTTFEEVQSACSSAIRKIVDEENQRKINQLRDKTHYAIKVHEQEGTFVPLNSVMTAAKKCLSNTGFVVIAGPSGAGKSRMGLELLRISAEKEDFTAISLDTLGQCENVLSFEESYVILIDDIFGKSDCQFNENRDLKCINSLLVYVQSSKAKVIITMRSNILESCKQLTESHGLFCSRNVITLTDFEMTESERMTCLFKYLRRNNIEITNNKSLENYMDKSLQKNFGLNTVYLHTGTIDKIVGAESCPLLGFPMSCYLFATNKKFLRCGHLFFTRSNEILCTHIDEMRNTSEKSALQFCILVYVLLNRNHVNINTMDIEKIREIYMNVCTCKSIAFNISMNEVMKTLQKLFLQYLDINVKGDFCFKHHCILEAVFLSCENVHSGFELMPLMDIDFILEVARPVQYLKHDGEVILPIEKHRYDLIANKFIDRILEEQSENSMYTLTRQFCTSPIIQQTGFDIVQKACKLFESKVSLTNAYVVSKYENISICSRCINSTYIFVDEFSLQVALLLFSENEHVVHALKEVVKISIQNNSLCSGIKKTIGQAFTYSCLSANEFKSSIFWEIIREAEINIDVLFILPGAYPSLRMDDFSGLTFLYETVKDCDLFDISQLFTAKFLSFLNFENESEFKRNINTYKNDFEKYINLIDMKNVTNVIVSAGKTEILKYLLQTFDHSILCLQNALEKASAKDHPSVVHCLLSQIDTTSFDIKSALKIACENGNIETVDMLCNFAETLDSDMLKVATDMAGRKDELDFLKCILSKFSKGTGLNLRSVMACASCGDSLKVVIYLLKTYDIQQLDIKNAMLEACKHGSCKVILHFADPSNSYQTFLDLNGSLNAVCHFGNENVVNVLLDKFNHNMFDKRTALICASASGRLKVVTLLLTKFDSEMFNCELAMKMACENYKLDVVRYLFTSIKHALFDIPSAFISACSSSAKMAVYDEMLVKYFLDYFNHDIFDLQKAMNNACSQGNKGIVAYLLKNIPRSAFNLKEAFTETCKCGKMDLARYFLTTYGHLYFDLAAAQLVTNDAFQKELISITNVSFSIQYMLNHRLITKILICSKQSESFLIPIAAPLCNLV